MSENDVRFESFEIPETADLTDEEKVMLVREIVNFIAKFSGEWLTSMNQIKDMGFIVDDEGNFICTKKHIREGAEVLGRFAEFRNLMAVGTAIQSHMISITHPEAVQEVPHRVPPVENRGSRSTCTPDCPPGAHNHYRKIVGD